MVFVVLKSIVVDTGDYSDHPIEYMYVNEDGIMYQDDLPVSPKLDTKILGVTAHRTVANSLIKLDISTELNIDVADKPLAVIAEENDKVVIAGPNVIYVQNGWFDVIAYTVQELPIIPNSKAILKSWRKAVIETSHATVPHIPRHQTIRRA